MKPISSDDASDGGLFARGRSLWTLVAGVVGLLCLVDFGQTYIGMALGGRPVSIERALRDAAALWLPLGVLIWPTLWFIRRVPLERARWWPWGLHSIAAVAFAVVLHLSGPGLLVGLGLRPASQLGQAISWQIVWLFGVTFFMYWAIVLACYSFYFYQLANERALVASQLHATLTESRLEALRAQLHPHFLFNTLNAISTLAIQGDQKAVVHTISRLGELLRVSLDTQLPQCVPLAAELEFLDGYLDIQRVRFADRLTVEQEVAPETLRALVPSLILQPLVENAIIHGIAARSGPGRITIGASRNNGTLLMSVRDTGPGFRAPSASLFRNGIGLANTRERLLQLYGAEHRIEFGAGTNGGAVVTLSIPFQDAAPVETAGE